jgi:LysM repeat protein
MAGKSSPQSVIDSYKRRQQMMPFIVGGLAVLLVAIGIIILVVWFTGSNRPAIGLFASPTPTATETSTATPVTPTLTPTLTSTETLVPTETVTPTPSGPYEYEVLEADTCWDIAVKFEVDLDVLLALNNFGNQCPISPGDRILIPAPDQQLPTETPIPADMPRGTKIEYQIKTGETLAIIAGKFNSTIEEIIKETNIYYRAENLPLLEDQNAIQAGQIIIVPANIVTPTPTLGPTSTSAASATVQPTATTNP